MLFSGRLLALLASLVVAGADAATTVVLPGSMCPGGDRVFADGFDAPSAIPHDPSNGSGGAAPGDYLRSISVPGIGTRSYYVHVPVAYDGSSAWPLLVALHGSTKKSLRRGYRVVRVDEAKPGIAEDFITGFFELSRINGRPADVFSFGKDAFLLTDDYGGVVYYIYLRKPTP